MGIEHSDNNDKGAGLSDHGSNNNVEDRKKGHQNPATGIIKKTEQNKNRSGSEQQNYSSNLNSSGAHYEDNVNPSLENRASEDDELEEEIASDHHNRAFVEQNELEKTDQDYRDGDNQSAEDQDDNDELRNGK